MADTTETTVRLKYAKGQTINAGNYESTRIDIGMEIDSSMEEISATFHRMQEWVNKKLELEVKKHAN